MPCNCATPAPRDATITQPCPPSAAAQGAAPATPRARHEAREVGAQDSTSARALNPSGSPSMDAFFRLFEADTPTHKEL
eukprot:71988-Alexandrium_andersonii.AAC.1